MSSWAQRRRAHQSNAISAFLCTLPIRLLQRGYQRLGITACFRVTSRKAFIACMGETLQSQAEREMDALLHECMLAGLIVNTRQGTKCGIKDDMKAKGFSGAQSEGNTCSNRMHLPAWQPKRTRSGDAGQARMHWWRQYMIRPVSNNNWHKVWRHPTDQDVQTPGRQRQYLTRLIFDDREQSVYNLLVELFFKTKKSLFGSCRSTRFPSLCFRWKNGFISAGTPKRGGRQKLARSGTGHNNMKVERMSVKCNEAVKLKRRYSIGEMEGSDQNIEKTFFSILTMLHHAYGVVSALHYQ